MHLHFIVHEAYEAPGVFLDWAKEKNYTISFSRVYLAERLPTQHEITDMLVIMGGPQSPATTKEECSYFDAEAEKTVIRNYIDAGKVVVGVCLGAQLIGAALGAAHERSPQREIGVFPISFTDEGRKDERFGHFKPAGSAVGHWHNDMPGLTADCRILAFSEGCPRQIIAYAPFVYGFQCHLEFTPEGIKQLIQHSGKELKRHNRYPFVQSAEILRSHSYKEMNELLFAFLDKLTEDYPEGRK